MYRIMQNEILIDPQKISYAETFLDADAKFNKLRYRERERKRAKRANDIAARPAHG